MEFNISQNKDYIFLGQDETIKEAYAHIDIKDNVINIKKIFVDPKYRGQGLAGKIMEEVVAYATENNNKIHCICSYAVSWFEKNPKYSNLLI